jgi:hypothetical protein
LQNTGEEGIPFLTIVYSAGM